ncbi:MULTISPECIES: flagellar biosynthesis anti-sigma factor FlgM [Geobacter]|uniref:Negative regulator of flagellin synthesis n=2 Tax=Geobacter TaxID=28231 RepID=A0A0C1R0V5_9BACT|nr:MULTISPECIES: flagellar biosynthesis anti-sigma factor FlgM [Geobacter]ANA41613.1 flagellar biosynthesis anti-sigma factor FlgM [Geobacter anodireducens]KIE44136.1 flagellar biosynthesis anti-sigma factor FlgM [Geobacter soli]MBE2888003.1 flagellar biosynthesis anti-sigma factor FlgM [Geobacter anodireducens]HMN03688.1 flagellar biosynthesis anti-sigma factor FlgM [Geobacter anodireducens]
MKIDTNPPVATVNQVKGETSQAAGADARKTGAAGGQVTDTVDLSRNAERLVKANATLRTMPDVRVEKVEELKKQIAAGEYNVSARDVAEKMLISMRNGVTA